MTTRTATNRGQDQFSDGGFGWDQEEKPPRDVKKLFLVIGLGALSWVATYVGMLELIEANMGELPLVHKLIIGFSVAMLMTMVVWLLDRLFAPGGFITKLLYAGGYLLLTVISVGFGFGFYWKVLESRSEASRSAESAIGQVQGSLYAASTRLEQLQSTLDQLTGVSTQKAEIERASGTSCPNSKPGDGPRRKMRDEDAARFKFASDFVRGRVTQVKSEMAALEVDLIKIVKDDKSIIDAKTGTRNDFLRAIGRKLDLTVTGFNAFRTDPQLKQIRSDLAERADKSSVSDGKGGQIACPDAQLATALKGVVRAIDQLPELDKPKIAAVEGSEATIEAFRRLTTTFYGLLAFKLPPSADELRELQKKAVQSVEGSPQARTANLGEAGLSKRDYVPLAIAMFVDICLLLVSMVRPTSRLGNLVPKMRAAERGPVIQILSRFNEIHRDRQIRENFEIFRHVVFDFHGDYYVAVPLDAPRRVNPKEREDLRLEAQLLSNLFSSFEKEKIFSRIMMPLFSTKSVQKRLRRQGSKFAESDAFRIYKFRNGAWSEIILGAVMGAARRVETDKRLRRAEERAFDAVTATFDPATAGQRERRAAPPDDGFEPRRNEALTAFVRPAPGAAYNNGFDGRPAERPYGADHGGDRAGYSRPAAYAGGGATSVQAAQAYAPPPLPSYLDPRVAAAATVLPSYAPQAQPATDQAARAANSNTAPAQRPAAAPPNLGDVRPGTAQVVVPFPAPSRPAPEATIAETPLTPAQPEPSVQVEAVRETVRYSVPTSSIASLPPSLAARLSAQAGWSQPQLANEPAPVLAAPVAEPPMSAEIVDAAEDFLPPLDSEDDPATRSMAGKFAPSAQRN